MIRDQSTLWRRMSTAVYAILYILCVHFAYVGYIHPTFEYAHYIYLPPQPAALLATYLLAWLPIVAYRRSIPPAQAAVALIYTLSYVPIQLSLLFSVEMVYVRLAGIQVMLAISMMVLFAIANTGRKLAHPTVSRFANLDYVIGTFATLSVVLLLAANAGHMRLVSFDDVYDLRFEAAAVEQSSASAYLISWLSYCFVSYLYARGIVHRKWAHLAAGFAASFLMYAATGAKAAILLLPITLGLNWLLKSGRDFLPRLLGTMVIAIVVLVVLLPDAGLGMWIKSIVFVRILGSSGWTASKYLEHFGTEGLTYYSHIGPINALTGAYPFGNLSLGQIIGLAYSGSTEANFNASFWASDGFAALGPVGVLVITPVIAGVLYLVNRSTSHLDSRFAVLWMGGFFIALLNVPLSTALLSGGGLIVFLLAWGLTRSGQRCKRASAPDPPKSS
jgi:hypothetical protein